MTTVFASHSAVEGLPVGSVLTVTTPTDGTGFVQRIFNAATVGETAIGSASTHTFGPYAAAMRFRLGCNAVSLDFSQAPATNSLSTVAAADAAYQPLLGSDVLDLLGEGAPVDYTDGTPPATGEGTAGIGSRYTDVTAGKLYLNGGTKAEPLWKIVTSA